MPIQKARELQPLNVCSPNRYVKKCMYYCDLFTLLAKNKRIHAL
jgi:hypothetical protein